MFGGLKKLVLALLVALFLVPALAFASFERSLSLGSEGPDVSTLQTFLKDKGFYAFPEITGYFGEVTKDALAKYQASVGIEAVGEVGPKTLALLNGATPVSSSTLSSLITALQQLLRNAGFYEVELSGALDPATLAAAQSISSGTASTDAPKRSGGKRSSSDDEVVPDIVAPALSAIASSTSQTSATVTWTSDETADSQVEYGTSASYGATTTLDASLVTSHAVPLSGLTASTLYHFRVLSHDAAGNLATSSDQTFMTTAIPDTTAPTISAIVSAPTSELVTITWTTDEPASSRVDYGATSAYGTASSSVSFGTSHSIRITGLAAATTYHFRIQSADAASNATTSSDLTFTTFAAPLSLPLANGSKVLGLGHSFIQRGAFSGQGTAKGEVRLARGVLEQISTLDGRFNIDIFSDTANPGFTSTNSMSGAHQGIGGDHLLAIGSSPGTINRTPYVLARTPAIVYLDIGTNDINSGVGGVYGTDTSAASVIAALDEQIRLLSQGGAWVAIQTISWRFDYAVDDARLATITQVNDWIKAQSGRAGVRVVDTTSIDGTASANQALFSSDGIHPLPLLAAARAGILLPILQSMVTSGDSRNLDPLSANKFPLAGFPGTAGTFGTNGRITGQMATGMKATMLTGTSTAVASKEVITAGNEWQVLTVTPVSDGTAVHEIRLTGSDVSTTTLGAIDGDWFEAYLPFQIDSWDGWKTSESTGGGPLQFLNELYSVSALVYEGSDKAGWSGHTGVLAAKLYIKPGLGINRIRYSSRPIIINFLSTATGTGTIKIGSPILREISDPRTAWNLP
jgi:peptidoglycan hydrolase-like protein with peptidoglycan-binding domain/lysophospholipase L1-like esterase